MIPSPYADLTPDELAKLCVWREARGEVFDAQRGVAEVIRNRVMRPGWWGTDITSVVLKPWQFSSFNHGDSNESKRPDDGDASWLSCQRAVDVAFSRSSPDVTGGAILYYDVSIDPPFWATSPQYKLSMIVGKLRFFAEV